MSNDQISNDDDIRDLLEAEVEVARVQFDRACAVMRSAPNETGPAFLVHVAEARLSTAEGIRASLLGILE